MKNRERLGDPRRVRALGLLALAAILVVFAACQLIAGVQSRDLDPIASGCSLPSGSGPLVRFANLAPTADAVDVCLRASGTTWGEPIILNGGTGCASLFPKTGFTYSQISVAFAAPGSSVDVKTVAGGSSCNASALSEVDGLQLQGGSEVTTLAHIGNPAGKVPLKLIALPEWGQEQTDNGLLRLVHAMPGTGPLDFGTATNTLDNHQLPATLTTVFDTVNPVAYGGVAHKGDTTPFGAIADNGYFPIFGSTYDLAAAVRGPNNNAIFLLAKRVIVAEEASIYAIGLPSNDTYPLAALFCTEGAGASSTQNNKLLLSCFPSNLPTLSFDVFNPALYGQNSPDFTAREQILTGIDPNHPNPIPLRNADVMCLVEVDSNADQQKIIAQAKAGGFPYSYTIDTDLTTAFSNGGKTQDAGTCAPPTMAACAGVDAPTILNPVFSCMEQNCSSENDDNGSLNQSTDCLSTNCVSDLAPLLVSYPGCFDCLLDYVASQQTYGTARTQCTTSPYPPLGTLGANLSLIVSRYPLANSDKYILPSTNYRRAALYSQVQFPQGNNVDFYCAFLMTPLIATGEPYLGCFGNGASGSPAQYEEENLFEAQLLAQWVKTKSGTRPAVILGDFRASAAGNPDAGTGTYPTPNALGTAIQFLASQEGWTQAQATNGWPQGGQCNYCPGTVNPLNGGDPSTYFLVQPFLYNWPQGNAAVQAESLIYTDNVLIYGDAGAPNAPVSPYYGLNIQLLPPNAAQ